MYMYMYILSNESHSVDRLSYFFGMCGQIGRHWKPGKASAGETPLQHPCSSMIRCPKNVLDLCFQSDGSSVERTPVSHSSGSCVSTTGNHHVIQRQLGDPIEVLPTLRRSLRLVMITSNRWHWKISLLFFLREDIKPSLMFIFPCF